MNMKSVLFMGLIVGFCALLLVGYGSEEASATDIVVDYAGNGDYTTIQEGIDNSSNGDTIYVWSGTYSENVIVNKSVSLIGNGTSSVINGSGGSVGINITFSWVNITDVKVFDCDNGIYLYYVENVSVEDCLVDLDNVSGSSGIYLDNSNYSKVANNTLEYCRHGIRSLYSSFNTYDGDYFYDGVYGLFFEYEYGSVVFDNEFVENQYGIEMYYTEYIYFSNISLYECEYQDIYVSLSSSHNTFFDINIVSYSSSNGFIITSNSNWNNISSSYFYRYASGVSIKLYSVNNNSFYNNVFNLSLYSSGIHLSSVFGDNEYNIIYGNFFLNITNYAIINDATEVNFFNTSSGGNMYANWTSPDSDHDGFVDNPFPIYGGGFDYLPLSLVANISSPVGNVFNQSAPFTLFVWSNGTINANNYSWSWGDGNVSYGGSSFHTYTYKGSFTVNLTVSNSSMVGVSNSDVVLVGVGLVANISSPLNNSEHYDTVFVWSNGTINADNYNWTWGDGGYTNSTSPSSSHTYSSAGEYVINLTIWNSVLGLSNCNSIMVNITHLYVITNVWELQNMSNVLSANYVLGNDIDATITSGWNGGLGFVPVGDLGTKFTGSFDGANFTISNLFINRPTTDYVGLFGYTLSAKVSNAILSNVDITGNGCVGGLVGNDYYGFVSGCNVSGSVSGSASGVGGLIGSLNGCSINDSYSSCSISSSGRIGGLVGQFNNGYINNCYATGSVSGGAYRGGLVGYMDGRYINNSYATGSVYGGSYDWAGGLVGFANCGSIYGSYATGSVNGDAFVGGLVGRSALGVINNSYATGGVSGTIYVGGLVGNNGGVINYSYSSGSVSGTTYVGGLLGRVGGSVYNSYYDYQTAGQLDNDGRGVPKSTSEMKTESTFVGWDFVGIWSIIDGVTYPQFYGSLPVANISSPSDSSHYYVVPYTVFVWLNGSAFGETYNWAWGDGSPSTNGTSLSGSHLYSSTGNYIIILSVWNSSLGFTDTDSITVSVGHPTAVISSPSNNSRIYEFTVFVWSNGTQFGETYNWSWGDSTYTNSTSPIGSHTYTTAGEHIITLVVWNSSLGYIDTDAVTVSVGHPIANISSPSDSSHYYVVPYAVFVWSNGTQFGETYNWSWGDGGYTNSTSPSSSHTFSGAGAYTVSLSVWNSSLGFTDTDFIAVSVGHPTAVISSPSNNSRVYEFTVFVWSNGTQYGETYNWSWGDGGYTNSTSPSSSHTFLGAGAYTVSLSVWNSTLGFYDTTYIDITVGHPIGIISSPSSGHSTVLPHPLMFWANGSTNAESFEWSWGDGYTDNSSNPFHFHTYFSAGVYLVNLTVWNSTLGFSHMTSITLSFGSPTAVISSPMNNSNYVNFPLFLSFETVGSIFGEYYNWTFGDGSGYMNSTILSSASHIFLDAGRYVVNLTVSNSSLGWSSSTTSVTITVGAKILNIDTGIWYFTIQEGVDNSSDGHTIEVYEGTFVEQVTVDKKIMLVGDNAIINGSGGVCMSVVADSVSISGFTLTNGSVGVGVSLSTNVSISHNMIVNNSVGVSVGLSTNVRVYNNTISINGVGGSMLGTSQDNHIYYNRFENNTLQTEDEGTNNLWDDGVSIGNWWSDYEGVDENRDGVGDTMLPHHGDRYPLTDARPSPARQLFVDGKAILYVTIVIMMIVTVVGVLFTSSGTGRSYFRRRRV